MPPPPNPYEERQVQPIDIDLADRFGSRLTNQKNRIEISRDGSRLIQYDGSASVSLLDIESTEAISTCVFVDGGRSLVIRKVDGVTGDTKYIRDRKPRVTATK